MSISFLKDCLQIFDYFKNDTVESKSNFSFDNISFGLDNTLDYTQVVIEIKHGIYTGFGVRFTGFGVRFHKKSDTLQIVRTIDSGVDINISIKLDDFRTEDETKLILIHGRKITNSGLFEDNSESYINSFEDLKSSKLISPIFNKE